jgi:hypothetical protein
MSELKLLDDRIKNLTVGLLGLAEGQTMQVGKSFLESVRGYMVELLALRRAQPENSRQHALQTGVCPMCEDCPDGCPVETPNDSRNKPENEPLTLDELRQMDGVPVYVVDAQGRGEWQFRINCGLEDDNEEWTADEDINWDRYGDLWRAYRAKPERSDT